MYFFTVNTVNDPSQDYINKKKLLLRPSVSEYDLARQVVVYAPQFRRPLQARNLASPLQRSETAPSFQATSLFTVKESTCQQTPDSGSLPSEAPAATVPEPRSKSQSYAYIILILALLASVFCTWDFQSIEQSFCVKSFEDGEPDFRAVHSELKTNLFGQSAATHLIIDSLTDLKLTINQLAILVLMGGSGTGKTWTNQLISRSLPENTNKVWLHLEHWHSKDDLNKTISQLKSCTWNFIFVEDSDRAEYSQIEMFVNLLKTVRQGKLSSPQKTAVIISSNSGQSELAQLLYHHLQSGASRLDLSIPDLQKTLNGVRSSLMNALEHSQFDYVSVPYLPLEKIHLRHCILQDLKLKKKLASERIIQNVMDHFKFYPKSTEYFSATGCKSVSSHVNLYA